jgi:transketolase
MRKTYVKTMTEEAERNKDIFQFVADIGTFTFDEFREKHGDRFVNVGISEANMVGMAAGYALNGKKPFIYTIAPFLAARSFEQIRVNLCYQNVDVKVVGCGSGYQYAQLGCAHHATDDMSTMSCLPNMTVISPADQADVRNAVQALAREHVGPAYMRVARDKEPAINPEGYKFEIGKAVTVRDGTDFTLIGTGTALKNVMDAHELLKKDGIEARVLNMHTVKPIDQEAILKASEETGGIVTVEEHTVRGGMGSAVAEVLAENSNGVPFKRMGIQDIFCREYGKVSDLDKVCELTPEHISDTVKRLYG